MSEFPGNSHSSKMKKEESENSGPVPSAQQQYDEHQKDKNDTTIKQVVTGKVRKKSIGERFREMFASEDGETFGQYLVEKVIIPGIREVINTAVAQTLDGIKEGIEDRISGQGRARISKTTSYGTGRPVTNYNARYRSGSSPTVRSASTRPPIPVIRRSNVVEDVVLESIEHCDMVRDELNAIIDSIGHCTVGDLYSLVGIEIKKTDESWGWNSIDDARSRLIPSTGEYYLRMPPPIPIEN